MGKDEMILCVGGIRALNESQFEYSFYDKSILMYIIIMLSLIDTKNDFNEDFKGN